MGLVHFGLLLHWIVVALASFTWAAVVAWAAAVGALAALWAAMAWALHRILARGRAPLWVALPLAWTAAEWLRGHLGDLSFPWLGLGHALTGSPEWLGIAELVGGRGVTFWLALANGVAAMGVLAWREKRRPLRHGAVLVVVVAAPVVWGIDRAGEVEEAMRPALEVAVVQPNIPQRVKLDREAVVDSTLASLERLMPAVRPGSADLVVWPEVTFPSRVSVDGPPSFRDPALEERIAGCAREARAPVLFGALGHRPGEEGAGARFNSAFLMTPGGLADFHYGKRFLVPFVERIPFVAPALPDAVAGRFGSYAPGPAWSTSDADGVRFGVLICYESAFPRAARALRRRGADVLMNITNDAWYGRAPWYARTAALWQHPAHLVMRAVEHRMGIARSANTGISMRVDPVGRVSGETPLFEAAVSAGVLATTDGPTLYTRTGDVVGVAAFLVTLLLVAAPGLPRPAREGPP